MDPDRAPLLKLAQSTLSPWTDLQEPLPRSSGQPLGFFEPLSSFLVGRKLGWRCPRAHTADAGLLAAVGTHLEAVVHEVLAAVLMHDMATANQLHCHPVAEQIKADVALVGG